MVIFLGSYFGTQLVLRIRKDCGHGVARGGGLAQASQAESHFCLASLIISNFRELIVVKGDEHRPARQNVFFYPKIPSGIQSRTPNLTPHVLPDCWLSIFLASK